MVKIIEVNTQSREDFSKNCLALAGQLRGLQMLFTARMQAQMMAVKIAEEKMTVDTDSETSLQS